jgi:hypothetical protein
VGLKFQAVVAMSAVILWHIMLDSFVDICQYFRETSTKFCQALQLIKYLSAVLILMFYLQLQDTIYCEYIPPAPQN